MVDGQSLLLCRSSFCDHDEERIYGLPRVRKNMGLLQSKI